MMVHLYVLQTGRTIWQDQQRMESTVGVPLSAEGVQDVADAAQQLAGQPIAAIYVADGEAEKQTAELAAAVIGAKVRRNKDLRELDYGLWQGLTVEELKRRHPKMYRQWTQSPLSIRPPEGESIDELRGRIDKALREIAKRHKDDPVLLVLRPIALGLLRCMMDHADSETIWQHVDPAFRWQRFDVDVKDI